MELLALQRLSSAAIISLVFPSCNPAQAPVLPVEGDLAFVNVNVVPMDTERIIEHQTVVIAGDSIVWIGPADAVDLPGNIEKIDGSGKFLMPGLVDMHVHIQHEADLPVYLANGVTTIVNLGGPSRLLEWREQIEAGSLVGPHLRVSAFIDGPGGPQGSSVSTPAEARTRIREVSVEGYDYVKVYNSLSTEAFDAIVDEAGRQGIAVIGHGVREPGLRHILENGQVLVAHAEEFVYTIFGSRDNRSMIPEAVELARANGTFVIPNLSAFELISLQWGKPATVDSFLALPQANYLHPSFLDAWKNPSARNPSYTTRRGSLDARVIFLRELTLALAQAGVPLLLGTDSPVIPGLFPGFSIQDDLRNMIAAGLTPFQALSAGTRGAGMFFAQTLAGTRRQGTVTPGALADLILLEENPLDDVHRTSDLVGVMMNGRWWGQGDLNRLLEGVSSSPGD